MPSPHLGSMPLTNPPKSCHWHPVSECHYQRATDAGQRSLGHWSSTRYHSARYRVFGRSPPSSYFAPTTASTTIPEQHSCYLQREFPLSPLSALMQCAPKKSK